MIHLTVPHGLEQYTGAAWGTRDVCQGPVEFLLALEHDEPVKDILRIMFAQQLACNKHLLAASKLRCIW
jgi:1,2-beta-oligoglucan phosphorylase